MKIPFLDIKREQSKYLVELQEVVAHVVASGWYVLGEEKRFFEDAFAQYCGVKHCIGVGNGVDALRLILLGYKELGLLHDGDDVILPANTYIATALAVSQCGLNPILVDCDIDTFNINPKLVEEKITRNTKAILAVHLYGRLADMNELRHLANEYNLLLLEDAAQSHGAELDNIKAGALGDAAGFSFYPTKNLGALGDAGAVTTNNDNLARVVRMYSNYGSQQRYENKYKGTNSRLDEIQAAVLSFKLKYLDGENTRRRGIAEFYSNNVKSPNIILPQVVKGKIQVWHQYIIRVQNRVEVQLKLKEFGIETDVHYPKSIHKQDAYVEMKGDQYPATELLQNEILSLPIYPSLLDEELEYIANHLNRL